MVSSIETRSNEISIHLKFLYSCDDFLSIIVFYIYSVVHLSGQEYEICIRTPAGSNHICYVPCTESGGTTAAAQVGIKTI